jgi:hypothetical protein
MRSWKNTSERSELENFFNSDMSPDVRRSRRAACIGGHGHVPGPMWRRMAPHRFGAWRRSGFRSTKLSASTKLDTKHKASFNH